LASCAKPRAGDFFGRGYDGGAEFYFVTAVKGFAARSVNYRVAAIFGSAENLSTSDVSSYLFGV